MCAREIWNWAQAYKLDIQKGLESRQQLSIHLRDWHGNLDCKHRKERGRYQQILLLLWLLKRVRHQCGLSGYHLQGWLTPVLLTLNNPLPCPPAAPHIVKGQNYFNDKTEIEAVIKVDAPNANIAIMWTPIIEWYIVRCGSKNGYQKHMCLKVIGLCDHNILTILGSIVVYMIGGTYMTTSWARESSLW